MTENPLIKLLTHKQFDICVDQRVGGRIMLFWAGTNTRASNYVFTNPTSAVEAADELMERALTRSKELGGQQ